MKKGLDGFKKLLGVGGILLVAVLLIEGITVGVQQKVTLPLQMTRPPPN